MFAQLIRWTSLFAVAFGATVAVAQDGPVLVTVDRAKVFRIEDGAAAVIVGNPFIADVAMFDQNTVVITGKSYGTTNLVILDGDNKPIVDEVITVKASDDDVVSVYRKASRNRCPAIRHANRYCDSETRLKPSRKPQIRQAHATIWRLKQPAGCSIAFPTE